MFMVVFILQFRCNSSFMLISYVILMFLFVLYFYFIPDILLYFTCSERWYINKYYNIFVVVVVYLEANTTNNITQYNMTKYNNK